MSPRSSRERFWGGSLERVRAERAERERQKRTRPGFLVAYVLLSLSVAVILAVAVSPWAGIAVLALMAILPKIFVWLQIGELISGFGPPG